MPPPAWEKWNKLEPHRLARYVNPRAIAAWFAEAPAAADRLSHVGGADRFELTAGLYRYLLAFDLRYDRTPVDFGDHRPGTQTVRTAAEVRADGGSCLDLSLVFAGICQHAGLRPIIVVLRDHTLVAVALTTGVDDAAPRNGIVPGEEELLREGLLADRLKGKPLLLDQAVREHGQDGRYVLVECTGLSRTDRAQGPPRQLDFPDAVRLGYDQLVRGQLHHLVDPVYFHLRPDKAVHPYPVGRPGERAAGPAEPVLGPRGTDRLTEMLKTLGLARPGRFTAAQLRRLQGIVAASRHEAAPRVAGALADLLDTLRTAEFLTGSMASAVHSDALGRAWREPGQPPAARPAELHTLTDYLEHIALHHHGERLGMHRWLASFVVRLADGSGISLDTAAARRWARDTGIVVDLNDMIRTVRQEREAARARLLISLHGAVADDWPPQVVGWWLLDGQPSDPRYEPNRSNNRAGLEHAIGRLVEWADDLAGDEDIDLQRIDIAVPTGLLMRWRPEESDATGRLIGLYDVTTRWSGRLSRNSTRLARKRWRAIRAGTFEESVDWLDKRTTTNLAKLTGRLRDGPLSQGIGLTFHPRRQEPLLGTVLEHAPVLLWPDRGAAVDTIVAELRECWADMPGALAEAYRDRVPGPARPLAGLRAVWDDEEWLRFCRRYAGE